MRLTRPLGFLCADQPRVLMSPWLPVFFFMKPRDRDWRLNDPNLRGSSPTVREGVRESSRLLLSQPRRLKPVLYTPVAYTPVAYTAVAYTAVTMTSLHGSVPSWIFNRPYSRETLSARIALIQVFKTFAAQSRDGLRFLHI